MIYTSGSTGCPKGVAVAQRSLPNLIAWHHHRYRPRPGDRASQIAGPAFDASVLEIWATLTAGATLCIAGRETRTSPAQLLAWLDAESIALCLLVSPMTELLLAQAGSPGSALRSVLTGGDWLYHRPPPGLGFELVNHYGPTETTVLTTCGRVAPTDQGTGVPDIGRPIPNVRVYLLDRHLRPVPRPVPGELCLGGDCLARGYLHLPAPTAERFVPDPFGGRDGERLYRSGDLARYRSDGAIEFLGRIDDQVKIRGFRIELGEIEAVLGKHPAVRDGRAAGRFEPPGGPRPADRGPPPEPSRGPAPLRSSPRTAAAGDAHPGGRRVPPGVPDHASHRLRRLVDADSGTRARPPLRGRGAGSAAAAAGA